VSGKQKRLTSWHGLLFLTHRSQNWELVELKVHLTSNAVEGCSITDTLAFRRRPGVGETKETYPPGCACIAGKSKWCRSCADGLECHAEGCGDRIEEDSCESCLVETPGCRASCADFLLVGFKVWVRCSSSGDISNLSSYAVYAASLLSSLTG
jgi:hypothetical protein